MDNKPAESKMIANALCHVLYSRALGFALQQCALRSLMNNDAAAATASSAVTGGDGFKTLLDAAASASSQVHFFDPASWEHIASGGTGSGSTGGSSTQPSVSSITVLLGHYAEEKMHSSYISSTFVDEIAQYAAEEVHLGHIDFPDCAPMLQLLEAGPTSVVGLLEEACQAIKGDDRALVDKIISTHIKSKLVRAGGARAKQTAFVIKHTFADVMYDFEGFVLSNKHGNLPPNALATLATSSIAFVARDVRVDPAAESGADPPPPPGPLGPPPAPGNPSPPKRPISGGLRANKANKAALVANYVMTKGRSDLHELLDSLKSASETAPNYVLCIKSGMDCRLSVMSNTAAARFSTESVIAQLQYYSVSGLITLAKKGFAKVMPYTQFYDRFRVLLPFNFEGLPFQAPPTTSTAEALKLCKQLLEVIFPLVLASIDTTVAELDEIHHPVFGKSCIFIRDLLTDTLEKYRHSHQEASLWATKKIQSQFRMHRFNALYRVMRTGVIALQSYVRCFLKRTHFLGSRLAADKIKSIYLMQQQYKRYRRLCGAVAVVKSRLMGKMMQRIRYRRLQRAVYCLQGVARGFMLRKTAISTFDAVQLLQRTASAFLARRRQENLENRSAIHLQHVFRGHLTRRQNANITAVLKIRREQRVAQSVTRKLQALWRRRLVLTRFREIVWAAVKLQWWLRSRMQRIAYLKVQLLALWLQSQARRISAGNRVHRLRVANMVQDEMGLLSDLFQKEISTIRFLTADQRRLGSGVSKKGSSRFERFLVSFDVNFDLSFAYPDGWLGTMIAFGAQLRERDKKTMRRICVGSQHTIIVDDCSNIYSMGLGDTGQLGHNHRKYDISSFYLRIVFSNVKIPCVNRTLYDLFLQSMTVY